MSKEEHIGVLVDRYMDGATTCAEEQELREYFRTAADIPAAWRPLKAMMAFVDAERGTLAGRCDWLSRPAAEIALPVVEASEADSEPVETGASKPGKRLLWWSAAAVAAVIAVLLLPLARSGKIGDYAIVDGERVVAEDVIMREAEDAIRLVSIDEMDVFGALNSMDELNEN